jgi:hypothetical protein
MAVSCYIPDNSCNPRWILLVPVSNISNTSSNATELLPFFALSISFSSLALIIEARIALLSMMGTIADDKPRSAVPIWIYAHLFTELCEIAIHLYSII